MKNIKAVLLCLACLNCISLAMAQEKIFTIDAAKSGYSLDEATYFYEDTTHKLTLAGVQASKMQLHGKRNGKQSLNSVFWYKVTMTNQVHKQCDFVFEPTHLQTVTFYVLDKDNKLIAKQKAGREIPFNERAWQIKVNTLPITIAYQDTITIFAQAVSRQEVKHFKTVWLGTPRSYYQYYIYNLVPQMFFQGALLLMFCYNLLFFFMVRDRAYVYYALYALSMALVSLDDAYSWVSYMPYPTELLSTFAALFVTILYTQFIRYFLNIPHTQPLLNRYCSYWIYARLTLIAVSGFTHRQDINTLIQNDFILLSFILDILIGLWLIYVSWKVNRILAIYMIMGYLAMTIPLSLAILKQMIHASVQSETDGVIVQVGVMIELILFSLGLGYRSKVAEKEHIKTLQENERIIKEQNVFLEQKVEERTLELNQQKEAVEEQNKHIMDNINYARRIQEAFLPKEETIRKYIPDFFIFFQPRDVVSGDFYFVEEVAGKVVVGAIDCTGHGVSGAFMTMLGNDILHNLVDNQLMTSPDLLLNELHKGVRQALKQHETENRDGMDAALLMIDQENKKVVYAGAKNPLIYIQNNELHIVKADKTPIGGEQREQERVFSKTVIDVALPTTFYLFSDGFQDQFGGEHNKKFSIARMKDLFLQIHEKPLPAQKEIIAQTFKNWHTQANEKQIDDVLIMGIRF